MSDFEIVIHLRDAREPLRIPLPGVPDHLAEADRQSLMYDIEQARLAEAPSLSLQTTTGHPQNPMTVDPHDVTEVDLIDLPDTGK